MQHQGLPALPEHSGAKGLNTLVTLTQTGWLVTFRL